MMRIQSPRRSGYLMIEVFFALGVLAVFAVVATQLFRGSFKLMRESALGTEAAIRFDAAVDVLRQDIARSKSVEVGDSHSVIVHDSSGNIVRWQSDGHGELSRMDRDARRNWDVGQAIEMKKEGVLVLLEMAEAKDDAGDIAMGPEMDGLEERK